MRLLIVEDSKAVISVVLQSLEKQNDYDIDVATTMAEAKEIVLRHNPESYFLALLNLSLPDAPNGEVIGYITNLNIPSVVFSAKFNESMREKYLGMKGVVDYIIKENTSTMVQLRKMVNRLYKNRNIQALVVDDSKTMRSYVSSLLNRYQFQVLEAENGQQAIEIIKNTEIKLVITDYNMEPMNGFELTRTLRQTNKSEDIVIIGLSGTDDGILSARFIKSGADDFLRKPFLPEEFFCRVSQNMDAMEKTNALLDASNKDYLTGLYNRRYFFENASRMLQNAVKRNQSFTTAVLDIDHFKDVNDTYGHDIGDDVLVAVARIIAEHVGDQDLLARVGGEEFCLLLVNQKKKKVSNKLEKIRIAIEKARFDTLTKGVTCSFGVSYGIPDNIEEGIKIADKCLYKAKNKGRNRVIFA